MKSWRYNAAITLGMFAACLGIAAWQRHEYAHERDMAKDALRRQAVVIRQVVAAGLRTHRRMGRLFDEQIQGVLDELVQAPDVRAIRVADDRGEVSLSRGDVERIVAAKEGEIWQPQGLQTTDRVDVAVETGGGAGRGPLWRRTSAPAPDERRFTVTLLIDRAGVDRAAARAARLRTLVALAGSTAVVALVLGWRSHIRALSSRARADSFNAEAQRLKQLSQAAAGLAHETRNPLGVVRGGLQRMARDEANGVVDHDRDNKLKLLIEECDRVTTRINQFLAYARPPDPHLKRVDVEQIVADLETLLEPDLEAHGVRLEAIIPAQLRWIRADADLLRQILFNLLQNAIAFAPAGGAVEFLVESPDGSTAQIAVADRGPGVDPSVRDSLFTPYVTHRLGGAGLGLAIVSRLAQAQGWRAAHADRPGGGSIFRIEGVRVASAA